MDCVADNGDVFIGYTATLRRGGVALSYSSILLHPAGDTPRTATSLRTVRAPVVDKSTIRWNSRPLGIAGTWQALDAPVERTLLTSDTGSIQWHCLQPRARSTVVLKDGTRVAGLGYVEYLTVSVPLLRLPIRELRWGRFLSETDSMVWIDWQGSLPLSLVVHNGSELDSPAISDTVLTSGGTPVLTLGDRRILREGPLIQTALSAVPGIGRLFPSRLLHTYECKWRSRGAIAPTATAADGWAIHEVVQFG